MKTRHRLLYPLLAAAALTSAFMLYTRPEFMVQISNQLWACF